MKRGYCIVAALALAVVPREGNAQTELCVPEQGCVDVPPLPQSPISATDTSGDDVRVQYAQDPTGHLAKAILLSRPPDPDAIGARRQATANLAVVAARVPVFPGAGAIAADLGQAAYQTGSGLQPAVPPSTTVPVPRDQGVPRAIAPTGVAIEHDREGRFSDPVDPITGEFIMHHVDLEFPSFGVPFRHVRTYRSRIDYDGPHGPAWDHSYNQRLVPEDAVPDLSLSGCGPVYVLTTGEGTSIRFRELSRTPSTILYESHASQLLLRGHISDGETTWSLTAQAGDVRRFDSTGRLVRWEDANGIGLTITWVSDITSDRISTISDSSGRVIEYRYDDLHRLVDIVDAASGLGASYAYGDHGQLELATRGDGRTERYEYSIVSGERGDWIPEQQLHDACRQACAVSSSSCDAGGACDSAVAEATNACLGSCGDCAATCRAECAPECQDSCGCNDRCFNACTTPEAWADLEASCEEAFLKVGDDGTSPAALCGLCAQSCDTVVETHCGDAAICVLVETQATDVDACGQFSSLEELQQLFGQLELYLDTAAAWLNCNVLGMAYYCGDQWKRDKLDEICGNYPAQCCKDGWACAPNSCNDGYHCEDTCKLTWIGKPWDSQCLSPDLEEFGCSMSSGSLPQIPSDEYDALMTCAGSLSDWAVRHGCMTRARNVCANDCIAACENGAPDVEPCMPPCVEGCESYCDEACRVDDCAAYCDEQDFAGQCEDTCTAGCIDAAHAENGPKYGHPADLDFNLVRIYDGTGALWLENQYGTDVESPDFDTVVYQEYGPAHTAAMAHADLVNGVLPAGDAAGLVETLDEYESVQICPYDCVAEPVDPGDVIVPVGDILLGFDGSSLPPGDDGGIAVTTASVGSSVIAPTTFQLVGSGSTVQAVTSRRTSQTNVLATSKTAKFSLALPGGTLGLSVGSLSGGGVYKVSGTKTVLDQATKLGTFTVFTGPGKQLVAYRGVPKTISIVASGKCTKPFRLERIDADRARIVPADACSGDLWLAPLASAASPEVGDAYTKIGAAAITKSHFIPTDLVPYRNGVVWRSWGTGTLMREAAPSALAAKYASDAAPKYGASIPMLSPPGASLAEPFFVFHHGPSGIDLGIDTSWQGGDNAPPDYEPPCVPTVPEPAQRGVGPDAPGPKPAKATVVTDLHGARWTFYATREGHVIRSVNHETGAVWSFEHDPAGQTTGVEAPDGARQCIGYDQHGNVTGIVSMPARPSGLPVPEPIFQWFEYQHSPSRLTKVKDPRDPSRALVTYEYDDAGNLVRTIDAAGLATNVTLVGGSGPDRAMPYEVRDPSGAVRRLTWDTTTGTLHTATADATSSTPITSEQVADEAGRVVWSRSPLGMITTASYDGPFLQGVTYDGDGKTGMTVFGYDAGGKLSTVVRDARQRTVTYDVIGTRVTQTDIALDASAAPATTCRRIAPGGRVLETVTAEGHRVRYHYDGEGRVVSVEAGDLGPSPDAWDDGCPDHPQETGPGGTIATYAYDTAGRLVAVTDARGHVSGVTVDGHGRPIIETNPDGTSVRRGFDALGQVVWEAVYAPYTPVGYRPPAMGDPGLLGAVQQTFDVRGRLIERRVWHFDHQGAPLEDGVAITQYKYDDLARTVTITDDANRATVLRSDGAGRPIEVRLPDGSVTTTKYLDGGRTIERQAPVAGTTQVSRTRLTAWGAVAAVAVLAGTAELTMAKTEYDAFLRPASSTTVSGQVSSVTYDAFDRPLTVSTEPGEAITLVYDRDGRVRERRGDDGRLTATWRFDFDALGRPSRAADPAGGVSYTYYEGLSSLPSTVFDRRGTRFDYDWSASGDLIGIVADAPAGMRDVSLTFAPDGLGRVMQADRDDGLDGNDVTSWWRYDSLGNVVGEGDSMSGNEATRSHVHDNLGRRWRSTYGTRTVVRYFDALDRVRQVILSGESPAIATYEYSGLGGPLTRTLKNGVRTTYQHDLLARVERISAHRGDGTKLASWTYELPLDGVPRLAKLETTGTPTSSLYTVDAAGRLIGEQHGVPGNLFSLSPTASSAEADAQAAGWMTGAATHYLLTGRSSWLERSAGTQTTSFDLDALDAIVAAGDASPTYDAGGALVQDADLALTYDAFGQLESTKTATTSKTYRRDALGRIVAELDASGAMTRYAYDGLQRTFRRGPAGDLDLTIGGAGLDEHLLTILGNGQRRFLHQDRLGSVQLITSDTGNPLEWISYTAYGEPTIRTPGGQILATSAVGNRFGFQGHAHDWSAGLVDMRARHYRPTWGRFLTLDPLGLAAGSPNLYGFVDASPLSFIDPLGLEKEYRLSCYCDVSHHNDAPGSHRGYLGDQLVSSGDAWLEARDSVPIDRIPSVLDHLNSSPTEFEQQVMSGSVTQGIGELGEVRTARAIVGAVARNGAVVKDVVGWELWSPVQTVTYDRSGRMLSFEMNDGVAPPDALPSLAMGLVGGGGIALASRRLTISASDDVVAGPMGAGPQRAGAILDTNALVAAIEHGHVEQVLRGRVPVVPITTAKEYLVRGDAELLRRFLADNGGRMAAAADATAIATLRQIATGMGRVLDANDARVAAAALREGLPIVTNDRRFARFLQAFGHPVEGF